MLEPIRSCVEAALQALQQEYLGDERALVAQVAILDFGASVLRLRTRHSFPSPNFHARFCQRMRELVSARLGDIEVRVLFERRELEREPKLILHASNSTLAQIFDRVARGETLRHRRINIYGEAGVGKTFLVEKQLVARAPVPCVVYSAETFASEVLTRSAPRAQIQNWRRSITSSEIFILDEVHRLRGKRRVQHELRTVLDVLDARKALTILISRHFPHDIRDFDHTLATRMLSSFTHRIDTPPLESRKAFVESFGVRPKDEHYRELTCLAQSFGAIERRLNALVGTSRTSSDESPGAAREELVERLFDKVARAFSCEATELRDPSVSRRLTLPRHVVVYCARHAGISGAEIARRMGYNSASSASYAIRKVESRMREDPSFRRVVEAIL